MALPTWITVTPDKPVYTEDDNQIQFSYAQNTTPDTRATSIRFFNAIAEEKHEYNPGSPDGEVEFFVYQFGRRELKITASSDDSTTPGVAACNPVTFFADSWQTPNYTGDAEANIDYTACSASAPGCFMDRNREGQFRCYTGENNNTPIDFNISLTVSSTSPWLIGGGDFWTGIPSNVYRNVTSFSAGYNDYPQQRTYAYGSGTDTPVTVNIAISGNQTTADRSTVLYLINKQGYVNRFTINQKGLVFINGHPAAGFVLPTAACPGTSGSISGASSFDPEGDGLTYNWGGIVSGSGVNGSFTFPTGSCQSAGSGAVTLQVTDSLGDSSNTQSGTIVSLPQGANDCISPSCSISCPSDPPPGAFNCSVTVSNSANSCPVSVSGTPTAGTFGGSTIEFQSPAIDFPGQSSGTVTLNAQSNNGGGSPKTFSCTSNQMNFLDPVGASISFSGDGSQSVAAGNVIATCSVNDPNGGTPGNFVMTGGCDGDNQTSNTSSLTMPFSGLDAGESQTCTASCTAESSGMMVSASNSTNVNRLNTATYSLSGVPAGLTCPAVASQTGPNGGSYSFTDPTCTAQAMFTCSGTAVFGGDSLSGTFSGGNVTVNRTISGITCVQNVDPGIDSSTCIMGGTTGGFGANPIFIRYPITLNGLTGATYVYARHGQIPLQVNDAPITKLDGTCATPGHSPPGEADNNITFPGSTNLPQSSTSSNINASNITPSGQLSFTFRRGSGSGPGAYLNTTGPTLVGANPAYWWGKSSACQNLSYNWGTGAFDITVSWSTTSNPTPTNSKVITVPACTFTGTYL